MTLDSLSASAPWRPRKRLVPVLMAAIALGACSAGSGKGANGNTGTGGSGAAAGTSGAGMAGTGGGSGTAGAGTGGAGAGGGGAGGAGGTGTVSPATWINPRGSVTAGSNPFGIAGYWYAYGDGVTSTATGNPYKSANNAYCIKGTALGDGDSTAHWGAGIGLDFNATGSTKSAYPYTGKVTAFRMRLVGSAPAPVRVHFVNNQTDSVSPFIPAALNESFLYRISEARVPLDWTVPNAGKRVEGGVLYSIHVQAAGAEAAGPIDVCLTEFEPVYDPNDGGGSVVTGGAYVNSDGWIDPAKNPFGIGGQVYAIGDGTSTTQTGNPHMNGKYCVAGTFTGAASAWGAGIAFDLNHMPEAARMPYTHGGKVGGFRIALSGTSPGPVHVNFVTNEPPAGTQPLLVARLGTTKNYPIAWAQVPSTWDVANAGATVGNAFYTVQILVDGAKAGPFNVCVDDFIPLRDNELTASAMAAATGYLGARTVDSGVLAGEYATWKAARYVECSDGTACVPRSDEGDCISEGIGYGMLITVGNNDRAAFDKLWAYFQNHKLASGVMAWQTNRCGASVSQGSATDGDLDAAMALIQAGCRWGGTYRSQATTLVNTIRSRAVATCGSQLVLKPGDNFGGCDRTNPSYFAPAYYKLFETLTNDASWRTLSNDSYTLLANVQGKMNGLVPNWTNSSGAIPSGTDGQYGYDASRTPWRIATDYAWNGEARAMTFLDGVAKYIDGNNGIQRLFTPNSAFRGGLATAGIHLDSAKAQTYTDAWLMTSTARDDDAYFPGTLRLVYLMLMANVFPEGCAG